MKYLSKKNVLKIMSKIQRLIDNGNIEELFLHEGSHISLDRLIEVHKLSLKILLLSFKKRHEITENIDSKLILV